MARRFRISVEGREDVVVSAPIAVAALQIAFPDAVPRSVERNRWTFADGAGELFVAEVVRLSTGHGLQGAIGETGRRGLTKRLPNDFGNPPALPRRPRPKNA
jgi:hypothetical protein